ncbi:response regulator [Dyella jiangningensis]|uniref:DNA-binding response regulator n=1 Tax=Dyella jiangningensis TaxID=1379159 RepID=A0A328P2V0_9GAMM|nr:response regulator transcription factor [Dyella jiangningensis]RAO74855.1 hypothetical protein CA260_18795 [Dyella jiangningensis]
MTMSRPHAQVMSRKPSMVLCDHHLLVAEGLARALGNSYEIKAVLRSGRDLEDLLEANPPDVVITEIDLANRSGLAVAELMAHKLHHVCFIVCTASTDAGALHRALQAGSCALVSKQEGVAALQLAVDLALQGRSYLSSTLMQCLIHEQVLPPVRISPRQQMVLGLMAEGMKAQQIADTLGLSRRTVEAHKARLRYLTQTHSPQELLALARRMGLLRQQRNTVIA